MKLRGVVPVIATPFNEDETIDEASLRGQVDFAIGAGAAAVCMPGFGSEFYKLSDPERYRVSEVMVEQAGRRVPTVISTGSGSVYTTIQFSRYAESIGADCLMVLPPRISPLALEELMLFYERVCGSVSIPVMVQDADFSGSGIPATVLAELSRRCSNLKFAKLEIPLPGGKCARIIRESEGRLQVLFGLWGIYMVSGLDHGACGIMAGPGLTEVYARIISLFDEGRPEDSKGLLYRAQPYMVFCLEHLEAGLVLDKRTLKRRGILKSERLREPYPHLEEIYSKEMDGLVELGLALCQEVRGVAAGNQV